jgi:glycosyltransferase involved in cell wall biosynthesis
MKIAVIGAKGLPPQEGGIEHHCAEIYPRMVAQGHSVDLFARSFYAKIPAFTEHYFKGVRVISLPCPKVGGSDVIISSALGAMLTFGDYDIVHFHALGPSLFSWLTRMISPAKIVVTCHGLDWKRAKWGKIARFSIKLGEKIAVSCAHEMVVVSTELQSYFIHNYSRDSAYIPNAPASYLASDSKFTWTVSLGLEPGRYMVFLGRLVPEKCPDLLIKAFQLLQQSGWKLVLVGGDDCPIFKAQLLNLADNNPNIIFTGQILGTRLAEIVRGSGLFVLPSDIEGLPMAMLEAMAEGIPILASDILPHRQLIGQNRGVLFRKGDINSCIDKLDWAINNTKEIQTFAEEAKSYVIANYNWEQITSKFIDLYHLISTKPVSDNQYLR